MSIEFPLLSKVTRFGVVSDPIIKVSVRITSGYLDQWFMIDTGADFTMASRRLARQVGLDWDRLTPTGVRGISGGTVDARLGDLPIRIEAIELTVRCLFVDAPSAMRLLGRADFLDRFVLTIDQSRGKIVLEEII